VLVFAPARWLTQALSAAAQDHILFTQPSGTVWSGSAQVTLAGGDDSLDAVRIPGRVHWDISPGWGTLNLVLRAECCTAQPLLASLSPSLEGWQLQVATGQSRWPASMLSGWGTPWNTLQLQGELVIGTEGFAVASTLGRWTLTGDLQLDALNMQSRVSTLQPLGSYRLRMTGGDEPQLALTTLQGSLRLQGKGRWSAGRMHFDGEASATAEHAQELSNLLNIVGRRDGVRSVISLG
jgi:general secretion pathway protein N